MSVKSKYEICRNSKNFFMWKTPPYWKPLKAQCLKIAQKSHSTLRAKRAYILSRQKLIKNGPFWRNFCGQTESADRSILNWWKKPKLKRLQMIHFESFSTMWPLITKLNSEENYLCFDYCWNWELWKFVFFISGTKRKVNAIRIRSTWKERETSFAEGDLRLV